MAKTTNKGLIAKKIGMTRLIDSEGRMTAATLLKVEDQQITKILTPERDGYHGFQVGYAVKAEKNLTKADTVRLRKSGVEQNYAKFCEFRTSEPLEALTLGEQLDGSLFADVNSVDVTGITKGRGFQGAVKRWGASIGRMSHGSRFHRRPGSLGQCTTPGRVYKNKHQPGHMGAITKTIKNLRVLEYDQENQIIAIKGSIPGHAQGFIKIRPSVVS